MFFLVAFAASVAAAAPATAPAAATPAPGSVEFDVQCMIATQQAGDQGDATVKDQLGLAAMFYFGRVDSAVPNSEALKARLRADSKTLEGRPLGLILQQCGQFMATQGTAMVNVGQALDAESKSAKPK